MSDHNGDLSLSPATEPIPMTYPVIDEVSDCTCHANDPTSLRTLQRPRGALARQLYEKILADERLEDFDKTKWYECDLRDISEGLADRFVQMGPDEETEAFLERSRVKSDWILTQIWHSFARSILGWFMTQTSINGLLGRGSMFVFSKEQFIKLLSGLVPDIKNTCPPKDNIYKTVQMNGSPESSAGFQEPSEVGDVHLDVEEGVEFFTKGILLDLGAGDGGITEIIAPLFQEVYVTEISPTMKRTLARKGFKVLSVESWFEDNSFKPTVSLCLNLLDRCDKPLTLLSHLREILKKNEKQNPILIVALVLPYTTYVEAGHRGDHKPSESIKISGSTFETQVASCEKDLFKPAGFQVLRWTRLPYLCEGDLRQAYYWLSDSVFVLSLAPEPS